MIKKLLLSLALISSLAFTACDIDQSGTSTYKIIYTEGNRAYYTSYDGS